ncbi:MULTISPECIES: DUF1934 domain-containing protein [Loigolactobacillus]|uniref:Uncharacterized protein n=1 Tax=Loigolactobacillus backii TaxID=375175 RepID=A0A192H1S1_9LACO|nr:MULTISPECIES: DUF1934 domain-containing protein [Loigolactobacillus]ANK60249.1 hypothetical protein AYR52_08335 [Loigolactobacillus backii]ANK62310.1 hypothetical protein AYR53_05665 [Loigolactobacillus backii]ANK65131.1 hypothetical protein AYR54_07745 [Loigolactobacillus backii]ANK67690.1 hypothetical protein AYR55_08350 [Loigolactobacillus backii]ANK70677.1 hypothetical protein AYR56_11325 [Loigolactobacillus backii]
MDLSTGLPIAIHLETFVTQDDEETQHVFDEAGQLVKMGQTLYIRYKETSEDDGSLIPVTLKVEPEGDVKLTRGDRESGQQLHLRFSRNTRLVAHYQTPYGTIPIETITPRLNIRVKEQPVSGEIYIEYQLFAQNEHLGDYRLRLVFTA